MDQVSNDFQTLAGWAELNKQYAAGQDERNQKRLDLLKQENADLQSKGVNDASLQGDIKKQEANMKGFGGFPKEAGLDVDIKDIPSTTQQSQSQVAISPQAFPSQEELDKIKEMDPLKATAILDKLQKDWRGHPEEMDILTALKHQKVAEGGMRDVIAKYPILLPGAAFVEPAYQTAKAVAHYVDPTGTLEYAMRTDKSNPTSPPSINQLVSGTKGSVIGAAKGLGDFMEGPLKALLGIEDEKKAPNP